MHTQWTLVLAFICSLAAFSLGMAIGMINPQYCAKSQTVNAVAKADKYESIEDLIKKTIPN